MSRKIVIPRTCALYSVKIFSCQDVAGLFLKEDGTRR